MKQLYFIRHGQSKLNRAKKWAGTTDTPLTRKGHRQAKRAGKQANKSGLEFDVIVSSPLSRAHQTAKHISKRVNYDQDSIILSPLAIERNFGILEASRDPVAAAKYLASEAGIDEYTGVETLIELQGRAETLLAYLDTLPGDTVLVVGHGALGRALRRAAKNQSLGQRGTSLKNAELVRFI